MNTAAAEINCEVPKFFLMRAHNVLQLKIDTFGLPHNNSKIGAILEG